MTGLGTMLLIFGIPCALIGVVMFLSTFFTRSGEFFDNPQGVIDRTMSRAVIGMIMAAVGGIASSTGLSLVGFAQSGRITRYQAGEQMPVLKDSLRDVTPVIGESVRAVVGAMRDGATTAPAGKVRHSCGAYNDPTDQFCKGCGQPLGQIACPKCSEKNDPDARFCNSCGSPLQS